MASVTIRYARAFADVVMDLKLDPAKVREELSSVLGLLRESPDLRRVWENPGIPHEQKLALLDAVVQRAGFVTPVRNFLAVLIDHQRMGMLPQIARQFESELNNRLGIADAQITSARELTLEERGQLELRIQELTGSKVRAQYSTDPAVLGGAVVKLGSTIYDGSVRGQLQRIREQLIES